MAEKDMAEKIKELRMLHNLTLEQVANEVGVGKSTVRKWETGMIANMRRDKIASLAKALHTSPAYLMGWDESDELKRHQPNVDEPITTMDRIIDDYGKKTGEDFDLLLHLDSEDRAEVRGTMKQMLKAEKYSIQEGFKNA